MQLDLETIIVLLVSGVLIWVQMKMVTDISLADAGFIAVAGQNSGGSESTEAEELEQTAAGMAGWDSLFEGFDFV
jgi:hypothetical protein